MKSPLGKLMKLGLSKSEPEENWDHHILVHIDGLTQAAKDMKDMRTCYDGLLSAAAATANSAYEFSESLQEMGNCLLEKTAIHDDGESGEALSTLGKVQFELQKLVDSYRSQVIMTITNPSESLLSELRKVEEMKLQCEEKREMFEYMVGQFREKGKLKHGKRETFTSEQLQAVREEYDEAARLCVFRVESLKQGQCRSLFTQAARHHAAQLSFFRRGLQSLEAVEPHIRNVAEKQHIDYELSELNDREEGDDEGNRVETNEDGELSFDYSQNKKEMENTSTSRNSMELDQLAPPSTHTSRTKNIEAQINSAKNQGDPIPAPNQQRRAGNSHSAPLYAAEKFDPSERIREMKPSSAHKFNRHVLPTPDDAKGSLITSTTTIPPSGPPKNPWHSSPLDIEKQKKFDENTNNNKHFLPLPRPVTDVGPTFDPLPSGSNDSQKIKRQAFSGPLAGKPMSSGPQQPGQPSSLNVSHNAPPQLVSSPKISELHELPRPPDSFGSKPMRAVGPLIGHSAPLGNRKEGSSRLPLPQLTVSRSFSIPSSSQRSMVLPLHPSGKVMEASRNVQKREEVVPSPPLTPVSLSNLKSPKSGQIRGGW